MKVTMMQSVETVVGIVFVLHPDEPTISDTEAQTMELQPLPLCVDEARS